MGKRQHQKDKMYLTSTEWAWLYGGRRPDQRGIDELAAKISRLPFNHCCLSLQPIITDPVVNPEGYMFEKKNLQDFVDKFKCDPITGNKPFSTSDIIPLKLQKTSDNDSFQCPVLLKTFSENSHIVCIRQTGNVFSFEAVEELNVKTKNFRDLLTDEPFAKKDIIVLQNPMQTDRLNPSQFYHFVNKLKWMEEDEDGSDPTKRIKKMDNITKTTLAELDSTFKDSEALASTSKLVKPKEIEKNRDQFNTALFSTGKASASFTSTAMDACTTIEADVISDDVYRYSQVKKKGYLSLQTNLGVVNIELYCQFTPKTCENFLKLSQKGYYDGTSFHRSIKNFMIQGGDPTGSGTGGASFWDEPFKDEFNQHLSHSGRGILSMANSGPNTNKSQFFITFKSCKHLDKKHTVFGKVVGGIETLDRMERIEVDSKDRPKEPIVINSVQIYVDPFKEIDDMMQVEREKNKISISNSNSNEEKKNDEPKKFRTGVGSFIDMSALGSSQTVSEDNKSGGDQTGAKVTTLNKNKMNKRLKPFGDFSSW